MPRSSNARANFTAATKKKILKIYNNRCAICLQRPPSRGRQCAHLLDASQTGAKQVEIAVYMGVISPGYDRSSPENGIIQCPTCHLAFFDSARIAFSPPPQVLQYIVEYLRVTDAAKRKPLHEVFRLLNDAVQGVKVDLPNAESILPFLGLYTLVTLLPEEPGGSSIAAHYTPDLFALDGSRFISVSAAILASAPSVARIFDVSVISDELPQTLYSIPLSPKHPEFSQQRYWRVPVKPEVILVMLMERIGRVTESDCEEINHARIIYCILQLHKVGVHEIKPQSSRKRMFENDDDNDGSPRKLSRRGPAPKMKGRAGVRAKPGPDHLPRKIRPLRIKI